MSCLHVLLLRIAFAALAWAIVANVAAAQPMKHSSAIAANDNPVLIGASSPLAHGRPRPFNIGDVLGRRQIIDVRPNPVFGLVAIAMERPAHPGENYVAEAGFLDDTSPRRSDIMVYPLTGGRAVFSLQARDAVKSAYSMVWSPSSKKLAFIGLSSHNQQRLFVWSVETHTLRSFAIPRLRDQIPLRSSGEISPSSASIAWLGDDQVLGVSAVGAIEAFGPERLAELGRSWRRAWRGLLSVDVWNTDSIASCRPRDTLVKISASTGLIKILARGPIEAASASPRGDRVAVVTALPMRSLAYQGRRHFERQAGRGDWEYSAPWRVDIVEANADGHINWLDEAEGPISLESAPSWSSDGRRLYAVERKNSLVENGTVALEEYEISIGRLAPRTYSALNRAEFAGDMFLAGEPIPDDFSLPVANGGYNYAKEPRFKLGDKNSTELARTLSAVPDRGDIIPGNDGHPNLTRARRILAALGIPDRPVRPAPPVAGAIFDGFSEDNIAVFHADTSEGTFVWAVRPNSKTIILLETNGYFANVLKPSILAVEYAVQGSQRHGLLYLPTAGVKHGGIPVILTAYPSLSAPQPSLVNANASSGWQLQQLISHGFAVFVVDLRAMPQDGEGSLTNRIMKEMTPALDAIRAEPAVDGSRLGYFGHSYGAVTGLTASGRTSAFSAMVASSPVADFAAYSLAFTPSLTHMPCAPAIVANQEELQDPTMFLAFEGPTSNNIMSYEAESPLNSVSRSDTPTLLIHGEFDAFSGTDQLYNLLADRGVPASLAVYRAEYHNIIGAGNVRDYAERMVAWFSRFLTEAHMRIPKSSTPGSKMPFVSRND